MLLCKSSPSLLYPTQIDNSKEFILMKTGKAMTRPLTNDEVLDFYQNIDVGVPQECWNWKGPTKRKSQYGGYQVDGKWHYAHRVMKATTDGRPLGSPTVVRHICHNKRCVNPKHLLVGSQADNVIDTVLANALVGECPASDVYEKVLSVRGTIEEIARKLRLPQRQVMAVLLEANKVLHLSKDHLVFAPKQKLS